MRSGRSRSSTRCREASQMPFRWTINPYRGCTHACALLLRAADARVPRLQRRPGLRARDRGQGQRARGAASGAGAPLMAGRARRARHQHRSVPVGRGALRADAGHLGGDARRRQPVLDPDQVAAAAAGPAADEGDRRSGPSSAPRCRCRRSTRSAWRATEPHTPNPRARLEAVAELDAGRDQDGGPDRTADARASTTRRSRWRRSSSWRPRQVPRT